VVTCITEASPWPSGTMVLEQLWLNSQTSPWSAIICSIADVSEHHVVRVGHLVNSEFVQKASGTGLRDAICE